MVLTDHLQSALIKQAEEVFYLLAVAQEWHPSTHLFAVTQISTTRLFWEQELSANDTIFAIMIFLELPTVSPESLGLALMDASHHT